MSERRSFSSLLHMHHFCFVFIRPIDLSDDDDDVDDKLADYEDEESIEVFFFFFLKKTPITKN